MEKIIIICVAVVLVAVLVFSFIYWLLSKRRVVKPSEVHVVRKGTKTLVYGNVNSFNKSSNQDEVVGNVYYHIPSWVPIWGVEVQILPLSNFDIDLKDYDAYDKEKLPFLVDVTAFFRIADYRQAASRIESNKTLAEHLSVIVKGAVRTVLAKDDLEQIMTKRSIYGEQFTDEVKENLAEWGVVPVKAIELMDLRDKPGEHVISDIMEKKKSAINMESRKEVAKNNQEAREAEIMSEQAIALKEEARNEEVGKRKASREKEVGIADETSRQAIQEQAKKTKEKEMDVIKVGTIRQAEIDKEKVIIDTNAQRERQRIDAEAKVVVAEQSKVAAEHEAQANFIKKTKDAEATLVAEQNAAKAIEAKGKAEAVAEKEVGLAKVQPQITLAKEIGENEGYQSYLIEIRKVEANEAIGTEQAKNLGNAQIKIIANAGSNVQEGVSSVMDLFTAKGGQALGGMIEAFAGTELGQQVMQKLIDKKEEKKS